MKWATNIKASDSDWKRSNKSKGVEVWELKGPQLPGANVAVIGRVLICAPMQAITARFGVVLTARDADSGSSD